MTIQEEVTRDAPATATPVLEAPIVDEWIAQVERNASREERGANLCYAVAECYPEDRLPFLEAIFEKLRPAAPIPALDSVMAEASFWADTASTAERKAYALACFTRLSPADQAAFLSFTQKRSEADEL